MQGRKILSGLPPELWLYFGTFDQSFLAGKTVCVLSGGRDSRPLHLGKGPSLKPEKEHAFSFHGWEKEVQPRSYL
jgi:hypothetical protein